MSEATAGNRGLAEAVGIALAEAGQRLVTAESCTGGLLAATLTEIPGSSVWFEGGFVTYRLSAKRQMIGVSEQLLEAHGAVSEPVVRAMAEGALSHSSADLSIAITGVAGPGGGDVISPVGAVWFGWASRERQIRCLQTAHHHLAGNRQAVREQAVGIALNGLLELL